eukprot:scaffold55752_cov96-Phaeocystis_antarctica.AAC.1
MSRSCVRAGNHAGRRLAAATKAEITRAVASPRPRRRPRALGCAAIRRGTPRNAQARRASRLSRSCVTAGN